MTVEDELRSLLRSKAASIRPSARPALPVDAPVRRRPSIGFLAAAAVVVVAMVGAAVLLVDGDDDGATSVDTDGGPVASVPGDGRSPLLDAVWPSAVEDEIVADAPAEARHQYPWAAAQRYLSGRVGVTVPEDGFTLVSGDATHAVLEVADGSVDVEFAMQRLGSAEDPVWYVVRATSQSVSVGETTYDGDRVRGVITPLVDGDLTIEVEPADTSDPVISMPIGPVQSGDAIELDEALPDEDGIVVRAIVIREGGPALSEQLVTRGGWAPSPGAVNEDPPGVWPWPGDAYEQGALDDPVETARQYLLSTVGMSQATVLSEFRAGDANSGEVEVSGDLVTTVQLREDEGSWYVVGAVSDAIRATGDENGNLDWSIARAGSLQRWIRFPDADEVQLDAQDVSAGHGESESSLFQLSRHRFLLATSETTGPPSEFGVAYLTELRVPGPTRPAEQDVEEAPDGVWPWPNDPIDPSVLDDPLETARAYVVARVGDAARDGTTTSVFQQGDARSGEVVFSGDVSTTVFVRQGEDERWFVVGSASDLVTVHDADDGSLTVRFETAGELTHVEGISIEVTEASETYRVEGGEERPGYAYTFGRDDIAVRNWFALDTDDGTIGLTEFALRATDTGQALREDAVWNVDGDDPLTLAADYLTTRLGYQPEGLRLVDGGTETRTVDWDGGSVIMRRWAEWWYVIESIGANVSFEDVTLDGDGQLKVTVFVGEAGALDALAVGETGAGCASAQAQPTGRGAVELVMDLDVATCEPVTVRALQNGAIAERRI